VISVIDWLFSLCDYFILNKILKKMAGRHYFPRLRAGDIGEDGLEVLPVFPALEPVRYKAGMDADAIVKAIRGHTRVAIDAPPCARKSVDLPSALYRGGLRTLVIHAMPLRVAACGLHAYVRSIRSELPMHVVTDYKGPREFPTSGIVFVSSSILTAYMAAWRAHGIDPKAVLFLDEVHESDAATATLRMFQTAAPGIDIYIEASATRDAGAGGYAQPTLPGTVSQYTYAYQPPREWDLSQRGTPWSLAKTTGDILVFEDDPEQARFICDKFTDAGVKAYRFTAKTDPGAYMRSMGEIHGDRRGQGICVIVVDYSFRSCVTFPTVTRYIDTGKVRYMEAEAGRFVYRTRDAYASEIHQAKCRAGRTQGVHCDYWRPDYQPEPTIVHLEGVEMDIACLLIRMLGRRPGGLLAENPYTKGMVPSYFHVVLHGEQPLRMYKSNAQWPTAHVSPPVSRPPSPIEANFPSTPTSPVGSVFTTTSDVQEESDGRVTVENFERARARRSHVREAPDKPAAIPRVDEESHVAFQAMVEGFVRDTPDLRFGTYYRSPVVGPDYVPRVYRTFGELQTAVDGMRICDFLRSLPRGERMDVCSCALTAYNSNLVTVVAAQYAMSFVAKSVVVKASVDSGILTRWVTGLRDTYVRADATAKAALDFLRECTFGMFCAMVPLLDQESEEVDRFFYELTLGARDDVEQQSYAGTIKGASGASGRYRLNITPNSVREKLALMLIGKKPGIVNVAFGDEGDTPVYTTGKQILSAVTHPG
jgi:hypothetical protein